MIFAGIGGDITIDRIPPPRNAKTLRSSDPLTLKLQHFPNLHDALKAHMHSKCKLGHENPTTGIFYHQGLLLAAHKSISSTFIFNLYIEKHFFATALVPFSSTSRSWLL